MEWISVKTSLPEDDGYVLAILIGYVPFVAMFSCDDKGFRMEDGCNMEITHWMPLPTPPQP